MEGVRFLRGKRLRQISQGVRKRTPENNSLDFIGKYRTFLWHHVPYGHTKAHLSHTVGKQEAHVVAHLPDQRQGLQVVVLRFPAEA